MPGKINNNKAMNNKIFKLLVVSITFGIMNYIMYLVWGFEIAILLILGMVEANIIINSGK